MEAFDGPMRQKADHAHAHHKRGERSHACLVDHPHWRGQPHAVCHPIPLPPQRRRPRQVGLPRPPRPLPRPKLSPALAREKKPQVKVPAAAEAAPGCSRRSPASWAPASSLPRIDGRLKLRLILLLNEGRTRLYYRPRTRRSPVAGPCLTAYRLHASHRLQALKQPRSQRALYR